MFADDVSRRLLHSLLSVEDKEEITQLDAGDRMPDSDMDMDEPQRRQPV
jgi:hypothetical protein